MMPNAAGRRATLRPVILSKKSACGNRFRQNVFHLRQWCGRGNVTLLRRVSASAARAAGFGFHSADCGLANLPERFFAPPKKGEGANCRNSVLAELQRPTADNAQYAAISSFSPDSWLTTAAFPHLKCLLPSPCMTHVTRFCFLNVLCISLHRAVLFQDAMSTIRSTTSCLNSGDSVIK